MDLCCFTHWFVIIHIFVLCHLADGYISNTCVDVDYEAVKRKLLQSRKIETPPLPPPPPDPPLMLNVDSTSKDRYSCQMIMCVLYWEKCFFQWLFHKHFILKFCYQPYYMVLSNFQPCLSNSHEMFPLISSMLPDDGKWHFNITEWLGLNNK